MLLKGLGFGCETQGAWLTPMGWQW